MSSHPFVVSVPEGHTVWDGHRIAAYPEIAYPGIASTWGAAPGKAGSMTGNTGGFELRGVNHLALVCRDMERTVDFYTNVLGMPLVKTIELPAGMGQPFFFDCRGGAFLALL